MKSLVPATMMLCVLSGIASGDDPKLNDYTNIDPTQLKLAAVEPKKDPKTGFVIGGTNTTELIRSLTEINGIAIADLEQVMRPDKLSRAGFLGKDERLLEVLAADNDWVLQSGLTHQELARHLLLLELIGRRESDAFSYHGVRFKANVIVTDGFQDSPFNDGTKTSVDVILENLDNGAALKYSPLVPLMVERYGFYEGKGTQFRVDPRVIVKVLSFLTIAMDAKKAAEPITLANVNKVGLLAEPKRAARYIKLGPGPNELLLYPPNGIVVVDDKNLKVLRKLDNEQTRGFSFSEDRSLTSWIKGKKAMIRDEKTGKILEIDAGQRPGAAVFSPDNQVAAIADMIITGSEGEGHSLLRVFDAKSGKLIRKLEISMKGYGGLSPVFSPDGKTLAVGNRNYETKLFDTETWNLRHTLPKRMTHEIAFSPDGKTLAAGYVDGNLGLWDVESGKPLHMVESGCYRIHSIAWNPTGDLLATSGPAGSNHGPNNTWVKLPGKVLLWNAKTFKVAKELMEVQWSGSVRFTRDGARLLSTVRKKATLDDSPRIAIWSTNAPPMKETAKTKVAVPTIPVARSLSLPAVAAPTVAVSPDGKRVVAPAGKYPNGKWLLMSVSIAVVHMVAISFVLIVV